MRERQPGVAGVAALAVACLSFVRGEGEEDAVGASARVEVDLRIAHSHSPYRDANEDDASQPPQLYAVLV